MPNRSIASLYFFGFTFEFMIGDMRASRMIFQYFIYITTWSQLVLLGLLFRFYFFD